MASPYLRADQTEQIGGGEQPRKLSAFRARIEQRAKGGKAAMANDEEGREPEELGQDPFVERLRPDPSEPPEAVRILQGVLGDSDREGYKRLSFTRQLDHYAEFRTEDVLFSESVPPVQPSFLGQQARRVGIRRDAPIEYTRVRVPRPVDEFDLDIRLGAREGRRGFRALAGTQSCEAAGCPIPRDTWEAELCPTQATCGTRCVGCVGPTVRCTVMRTCGGPCDTRHPGCEWPTWGCNTNEPWCVVI